MSHQGHPSDLFAFDLVSNHPKCCTLKYIYIRVRTKRKLSNTLLKVLQLQLGRFYVQKESLRLKPLEKYLSKILGNNLRYIFSIQIKTFKTSKYPSDLIKQKKYIYSILLVYFYSYIEFITL